MAEPAGKKNAEKQGVFKSAFRTFSPKAETRLAGLDGLSAKFGTWSKYLQDKGGLALIPGRDCAKIAAAAEAAQGKLHLKIGQKCENGNDYVKANGHYEKAHSHFAKADEMRAEAGLSHSIEAGMKSYALARYTLAGRLLGIGDISETLKSTPDGVVRFVSDAVAEVAAEQMETALELLLIAGKSGRKISKLPVAKIGLEAGYLYEQLEEKDKAFEIYVKTGDWCTKAEKYADAADAYKKAAAANQLMSKNYLALAEQMDILSRVAGRIRNV